MAKYITRSFDEDVVTVEENGVESVISVPSPADLGLILKENPNVKITGVARVSHKRRMPVETFIENSEVVDED